MELDAQVRRVECYVPSIVGAGGGEGRPEPQSCKGLGEKKAGTQEETRCVRDPRVRM